MLGILCGLQSEAKIARGIPGALIACAAARPRKARDLARDLVAQGATKLMSFGIAGALQPGLRLGDLVIGTHVGSVKGEFACDSAWGADLAARMPHARPGGVYGSEMLVSTAQDKAALFKQTSCAIVDMESQCAAEVAAEHNLPLMVVRSVCDAAHMNVPPVVMAAIAEDGSVHVGRALSHIAGQPRQIVDLFYVMRGTAKALAALKAVAPWLVSRT